MMYNLSQILTSELSIDPTQKPEKNLLEIERNLFEDERIRALEAQEESTAMDLEKDIRQQLRMDSRLRMTPDENRPPNWNQMKDITNLTSGKSKSDLRDFIIRDDDLLKQKSLAVKQYLNDNLMPELTEVVVELCRQKPESPIDFAINFLSQKIDS